MYRKNYTNIVATKDNINHLFNKLRKNIEESIKIEIPKPKIEEPNNDNIGKQIAYYRKIKGLTQNELANILNVSKSSINAYENREIRLVNTKFLKKIFKVLDINNKIKLPEYEEFILDNQSQKLKKILKENKLNYKQFSKAINVDYSNVKKWLKGQAIMSKASYNKVKNVYNI